MFAETNKKTMLEFWKVNFDDDFDDDGDEEMSIICASESDLMNELDDRGIVYYVESKYIIGKTITVTKEAILRAIDEHETFDFVFEHAIAESGFDMVAFFRSLIIDVWPKLIQRAKSNVQREIELQKEFENEKDQDLFSTLDLDRDILKMLQMDDATIVAYLIDCLRHVAKQLDSDHVDDTGFSIN